MDKGSFGFGVGYFVADIGVSGHVGDFAWLAKCHVTLASD